MAEELAAYKQTLSEVSAVIDADYRNAKTENVDDFKDPFHSNEIIARQVVNQLIQKTAKSRECCQSTATTDS